MSEKECWVLWTFWRIPPLLLVPFSYFLQRVFRCPTDFLRRMVTVRNHNERMVSILSVSYRSTHKVFPQYLVIGVVMSDFILHSLCSESCYTRRRETTRETNNWLNGILSVNCTGIPHLDFEGEEDISRKIIMFLTIKSLRIHTF